MLGLLVSMKTVSSRPIVSRLSSKLHRGAVLQGKMHFSELMTGMLNLDDAANSIKMVGPSINCEGTVKLPGGLQRSNPHVQSFAVATDQTGVHLHQFSLSREQDICACLGTPTP